MIFHCYSDLLIKIRNREDILLLYREMRGTLMHGTPIKNEGCRFGSCVL